jgi:antitoxin (DNA-binding transcriptional repressor) of toxin-antitoxin stability system
MRGGKQAAITPQRTPMNRNSERPGVLDQKGRAMTSVTIEEAQARLPELIQQLVPGEELLITQNAQPVAKLIGQPREEPHPVFGRGRGKVIVVSEDDEHLKDFEDYMP